MQEEGTKQSYGRRFSGSTPLAKEQESRHAWKTVHSYTRDHAWGNHWAFLEMTENLAGRREPLTLVGFWKGCAICNELEGFHLWKESNTLTCIGFSLPLVVGWESLKWYAITALYCFLNKDEFPLQCILSIKLGLSLGVLLSLMRGFQKHPNSSH